jgi:hypothetical protein
MIPVVIEEVYTCMQKDNANVCQGGIEGVYGGVFPISNRKAIADSNY